MSDPRDTARIQAAAGIALTRFDSLSRRRDAFRRAAVLVPLGADPTPSAPAGWAAHNASALVEAAHEAHPLSPDQADAERRRLAWTALAKIVGVAAVVAGLGAAGWLTYSAVADLQRRGRLGSGTEPLQVTGARARQIAETSHSAARDALGATLAGWQQLAVTRGIGTPLQESFDLLEHRTVGDLGFQDLVMQAEAAHSHAVLDPPSSPEELARSTVELDQFTADLRRTLHERAVG